MITLTTDNIENGNSTTANFSRLKRRVSFAETFELKNYCLEEAGLFEGAAERHQVKDAQQTSPIPPFEINEFGRRYSPEAFHPDLNQSMYGDQMMEQGSFIEDAILFEGPRNSHNRTTSEPVDMSVSRLDQSRFDQSMEMDCSSQAAVHVTHQSALIICSGRNKSEQQDNRGHLVANLGFSQADTSLSAIFHALEDGGSVPDVSVETFVMEEELMAQQEREVQLEERTSLESFLESIDMIQSSDTAGSKPLENQVDMDISVMTFLEPQNDPHDMDISELQSNHGRPIGNFGFNPEDSSLSAIFHALSPAGLLSRNHTQTDVSNETFVTEEELVVQHPSENEEPRERTSLESVLDTIDTHSAGTTPPDDPQVLEASLISQCNLSDEPSLSHMWDTNNQSVFGTLNGTLVEQWSEGKVAEENGEGETNVTFDSENLDVTRFLQKDKEKPNVGEKRVVNENDTFFVSPGLQGTPAGLNETYSPVVPHDVSLMDASTSSSLPDSINQDPIVSEILGKKLFTPVVNTLDNPFQQRLRFFQEQIRTNPQTPTEATSSAFKEDTPRRRASPFTPSKASSPLSNKTFTEPHNLSVHERVTELEKTLSPIDATVSQENSSSDGEEENYENEFVTMIHQQLVRLVSYGIVEPQGIGRWTITVPGERTVLTLLIKIPLTVRDIAQATLQIQCQAKILSGNISQKKLDVEVEQILRTPQYLLDVVCALKCLQRREEATMVRPPLTMRPPPVLDW
ncbi:hypothetical protein RvY_02453-2 [Ramazzottius varieornatus]|uniref:Uncharacterized protein n=1 Tax=Ramazzottius varieornatus TaxID=947166 RepID=A0A1D1UJT5_RAMVA|nr:hypothetical protein RvY_02453-2 [Ramazzottius varieornatus]